MVTATARTATPHKLIYTRPWMYEKQSAAMFDPARFCFIEASTKSGKTIGCIIWLAEQAMLGESGYNYWWIAPSYRQSRIAYERLKRGLPEEIRDPNESRLSLNLLNGTIVSFVSAEKPDLLYGEDVYGAVLDEASRMREEAWHAIRSTLTATQGPARIIGNVKGRRNWFYRMARKAEAGEANAAYHKLTCKDAVDAGIFPAEEVEAARRELPEAVFNELFMASPSDDTGNPFGLRYIHLCLAPLSDAEPVCWGWDLAKSQDWTVGIGLDKDGQVCRFERFQKPWEQTYREIIRSTNHALALVDSTGVGDPIVERLQREGGGNFEGFHFSQSSKQKLMEGLALAIQRQEVFFPSGPITSELEAFEYEYTRSGVRYSAPEGMHDDCVCALALAVAKRPKAGMDYGILV